MKKRKCIFCKKFFSKKYLYPYRDKYCSHSCAAKFYNPPQHDLYPPKKCIVCGRVFYKKPTFTIKKWKEQIYCSHQCAFVSQKFKPNKGWFQKKNHNHLSDKRVVSRQYRTWRNTVLARDNNECQICGKIEEKLHANHIKKFADYPELRFEATNGITLCQKCHMAIVTRHETGWESYFNFNLETRGFIDSMLNTQFYKQISIQAGS